MSVYRELIHAVPMPTALTQMVTLTAHVMKALKEMDSPVQVNSTLECKVICSCLVTNLTCVADIPECERGLDDCDLNATCSNTFGGYNCSCNTGFTGDGFNCTGMCTLDTALLLWHISRW